jgi:hypothetical protein
MSEVEHPGWCDSASRCTVGLDPTNGTHYSTPVVVTAVDPLIVIFLAQPVGRRAGIALRLGSEVASLGASLARQLAHELSAHADLVST